MQVGFDLYNLFDKLSIAIFVLRVSNHETKDFTIMMANEENKVACGLDMKKFIGHELRDAFPGIYDLGLPNYYYQSVKEHQEVEIGEFEYADYGLEKQTYILKATPLGNDEVMISYENISQLKEAKRQLEKKNQDLNRKNKSLEEFAYLTSHDLQEPLNTISGFVDILKSRYYDQLDSSGQKCMDYIDKSACRMRDMIKGILHHSKLGMDLTITDIDLNKLLLGVVDDLQGLITEKKATVKLIDLPKVKSFDLGLRIILQNLIENGLKYQPEDQKPVIEIMFEEKEDNWEFGVKDNGVGIKAEHQEKIFKVFQRLQNNQSNKGTGLGLANCLKLIHLIEGEIWVESSEGEGSTFYFTLPKIA
ncbi:sensor histidine kinase [Flammeovirga pacifica]|uniref:histidine kinase n=1 Tax=Flammeovirga pacifica TaxID=915059 RepID=A0A1S1Z1E7_FLAPC|nr:ATP-binding protein [Flammeovirga pacifica]OHX67057.1 hypothetical protein NH26_12225 [Flammeovirga pacifica]